MKVTKHNRDENLFDALCTGIIGFTTQNKSSFNYSIKFYSEINPGGLIE